MSIFRHSREGLLDQGTHQAVAEALSETFGLDDDDFDLDSMEDTPEETLAEVEIEFMLDDQFMDPEIEDLFLNLDSDADLDDEIASIDSPAPTMGRVSMAAETREDFGFLKAVGRGIGGAVRLAGQLGDQEQDQSPMGQVSSFFQQGQLAAQQALAPPPIPPNPWQSMMSQMTSLMDRKAPSVEAGSSSLPPVYVSDPVTADQASVHTRPQAMRTETSFGASADHGLVGCQTRPRAKKAAQNAVFRGAQAMASAPFRPPQPLVEDTSARPVLLSDGRVIDKVHGELSTLPCPSCARVSKKAVYGGTGHACPVCDGFGAVLIPDGDVPSYAGCSSYGFIQFLLGPIAKRVAARQEKDKERKAAEAVEVAKHKKLVHARLLKKLEEQKKSGASLSADDEGPPDKGTSQSHDEDQEDMEDIEVFGSLDDMLEDFGDDLEDEYGDDSGEDFDGDEFGLDEDEFGLDDDLEDDDFGIDEWADSVFGSEDDFDEDDDFDDLDDDDDDEYGDSEADGFDSVSASSYGLVRAMIPATGGW